MIASPVNAVDRLRAARAGWLRSSWTMAVLGVRMMLHDRAKLVGTVFGVIFAVVLANQQLGILFGLLAKNTMLVDHAGADLWIVPPHATAAQPGQRLSTQLLYQARSTPGVARAGALVVVGSSLTKPGGGSEPITLVGVDPDAMLGGPWNLVAGTADALRTADTLIFEDSQRARFGGLNLGSIREIAGHRIRVGGFVWGLLPFGPPYTFGQIDTVRTLGNVASDELNFVLVRVAIGADVATVARALARRCPSAQVYRRDRFHAQIVRQLLRDQLGVSFGTSTAFGLVIGFIIVALSMFSSVIDHVRELATLKALGLTNGELTRMMLAQSLCYAAVGSLLGLGLVGFMARAMSSATLTVIVPPWLVMTTPMVMGALCMLASLVALRRVRRLEPGRVFR